MACGTVSRRLAEGPWRLHAEKEQQQNITNGLSFVWAAIKIKLILKLSVVCVSMSRNRVSWTPADSICRKRYRRTARCLRYIDNQSLWTDLSFMTSGPAEPPVS